MSMVTYNDESFDFNEIKDRMDGDLSSELQANTYASEQDFFDAYVAAHAEKFGQRFVVS